MTVIAPKSDSEVRIARERWQAARDRHDRGRDLHLDPAHVATLAVAAESARRDYVRAQGHDPDAKVEPPKAAPTNANRPLTTYGSEQVEAALAVVRADRAALAAEVPAHEVRCANAFLQGLKSGDAATLAFQNRAKHLSDVERGLERLQTEAQYASIRRRIAAGIGALRGETDPHAALAELHYRQVALERDVDGIAERFEAAP